MRSIRLLFSKVWFNEISSNKKEQNLAHKINIEK